MFEKEAEDEKPPYAFCSFNTKCELWKDGFQQGAKFGYNKANEWHFVKDGLPKTSGRYLVYTGGEPFILYFNTEVNYFGYWVVSLEDDWGFQDEDFETVKDRGEDDVVAWKEIIPPKECYQKSKRIRDNNLRSSRKRYENSDERLMEI